MSEVHSMSAEKNEAIIRRSRELWNDKNLSVIDELYATDYINHDPAAPKVRNLNEFKQWVERIFNDFPYVHKTCEGIAAVEDKVTERWTICGKNRGEGARNYRSANRLQWAGMSIYRIVEGKIVECWWSYDPLKHLHPRGRRTFWRLTLEEQLLREKDRSARNAAITRQYAAWYIQCPDIFKWAGMAAFVSNAVDIFISIADEGEWKLFKCINDAIFSDIGWAHLAYLEGGLEMIEAATSKNGSPDPILGAFTLLGRGEKLLETQGPELAESWIREGTKMLAQHEQYNIAQPFFASFKPPILALLQTTLGLIDFDGDPLKIDQSVKVRFQDIVDIRQIWNVGKADQRWKFVTETLFPRWWQADRNFNETHRRLERLAVQAKSPNLSAFGGNMLKWVTNGVSTVAKWLQDAPKRLAGSTEKMIRAQSESKEKKGFKDIIKDGLIFFFLTVLPLIFIVLIAQLVLRAPGLVIVFLLLHGNRLREWWNNQPKQARLQKLRLTLSVAIGAVLLVIGCQLSSRLGPGIIDFLQPIWPTPNVWPRSAFVVPQEVVRAKVGQKLHLNSYHMSIEELDVIEILVNGHQLGGEISAVAGQAIFSNYLASIQVRSKVRPVLTNTIRLSYLSRAWAVTIQWEGHVPGVYELKLVATDVAGHQGQPLVQRIEVRE